MRARPILLALALATLATTPALAANYCETAKMMCVTTMPVGGYCECHVRANIEDGTVIAKPPRGRKVNASAGGCGATPNVPGCR